MNPRFAALSVLRHGSYARFAVCRFITTLSWQMLGVAVGWRVYALTHDPLSLGLVGLSEFLPFTCLVLLGGHLADRIARQRVLQVTWSIETVCIGALVVWSALGFTAVWPIYLAVGVFGGTRAFWAPAMQAMVPNLVPREEFPRALGLNATLFQAAVITGPAVGGVLYLLGSVVVFGACLALFVVTVSLSFTLRPHSAQAAASSGAPGTRGANVDPGGGSDASAAGQVAAAYESRGHVLLEGLRYVMRQRVVLGVISLDLFAVLFGGATALLPIFAGDVLHIGPAGLGLLRTAPGVGAALTAGLLTLRPIDRRAGPYMFAGVAAFGLCTLVFGSSRSFPLSLAALFVLGCGDMVSVYVRGILVQLNTPDEIRGRVSAINSMFIGASNELGEFESGVTARWFGAVRATLLGGALTLLVVCSWMGLFPQLRRLDHLR
ncbi:MAG TPA: MFS transporter [Steroidobacteraceae bacterium]|nr:MFS transporter [Steroidobacteraceae bacterium]